MGTFDKLKKTIQVDKPVFKLADPNNPATYYSPGTPSSPDEIPPSTINDVSDQLKQILDQKSTSMPSGLTPKPAFQQQMHPASILSDEELSQVDDPKAVSGNIDDILKLNPDKALGELKHLNEYDMTDNDKSKVWDKVKNYLNN
jgi:hypothetical protein